jgi:hypothetical protein
VAKVKRVEGILIKCDFLGTHHVIASLTEGDGVTKAHRADGAWLQARTTAALRSVKIKDETRLPR